MFQMLLRSRRYAGRFVKRRSWDFSTPQKVPNPYGAGYINGLLRRAVFAAVEQSTLPVVRNRWARASAAGLLSCGQRGGSFPRLCVV